MLFHITMTHSVDDCPGYDRQKLHDTVDSFGQLDSFAKELDVKVHFLLWGAPEHVLFALLEANDMASVSRYVNAIPIRQEFKVTPVQNFQEVMAMTWAMLA